jgi:hypothetical protein
MTALIRYVLSMLVRGQGYIAPIVLYGSAIVVLTTNDRGSLPETYSACALTLFVCQLWLTAAMVNTEDREQRAMTAVAAGGAHRVLIANVLAAALICLGLTAIGLAYPIVAGEHVVTAAGVAVGALAQLACGAAGIAGGLLCSRLVIRRAGHAVFVGLGIIGVMILVKGVPPVGPVMMVLDRAQPPSTMLGPVAAYAGIAVAMLGAAAAAAHLVARTQD